MEEVLKVSNLTCELEQQRNKKQQLLVQGVSFSLYSKKTLALVGESGSGKSTTALALLGLLEQFSSFKITGSVIFEGHNLLTLSEKKLRKIRGANVGMIFQDPAASLNPVFSIGQQVAEMWLVHRSSSVEEAEEQASLMLARVGLQKIKNFFNTYPHELSGGMKQRVMIAMSLICSPKILIADEPTTALDLTVQKEILLLLKELQRENGLALLIITHDMGVVAEMADEVAVMYASEIVEFGPIKSLFEKRLHPYTQALFASRPTPQMRKKTLPAIPGTAPSAQNRPSGCPFHNRCPFAMPKCKEGAVPKFYDKDNKEHWAKCWLLEGEKL